MTPPAVRVTAVLDQSAAIGVVAGADYRQDTHDHVPGAVLRGALAAHWLRDGEPDAAFLDAFEGDGGFGPLHSADSLPIPLSVSVHKTSPGPGCHRWWWDAVTEPTIPERCPDCLRRLVPSTGQPVGRPATVARTRVELDRDGVAADGKLFRRAALAPGTRLQGWVTGPAVAALTGAPTPVRRLRFGGERSIRGQATIAVTPDAPPALECHDRTVVLRLAGPGVFVNPLGHPSTEPNRDELATVLGCKVKKIRKWIRWTEIGGWHMASGLPKPRERAVVAGSTYAVELDVPPTPDALAALAVRGIGLRRREGCGALAVMPPQPVAGTPLAAAVAPVTAWTAWPAHATRLRAQTAWPIVRPDPLRQVLFDDRALTAPARDALQRLHALTDGALATALLDHLDTP